MLRLSSVKAPPVCAIAPPPPSAPLVRRMIEVQMHLDRRVFEHQRRCFDQNRFPWSKLAHENIPRRVQQQQHVRREPGQQEAELVGRADPVGVEEDAVERALEPPLGRMVLLSST